MSDLKQNLQEIQRQKTEYIVPENIKKDVTIFNVIGTLEEGIDTTTENPVTADDMAGNKEAFVNGEKIIGNAYTIESGNSALAISDPYEYKIGPVGQVQIYGSAPTWSDGQTSTLFKQGSKTFISISKEDQPGLANAIDLTPDKLVKGNNILGIEGSAEAGTGAKIFKNEEEMQADLSSKEGDLAIIYRSEVQNMTAETETQYISFPETVTLLEAFEDSTYIRLKATDSQVMFDGNVQLDKTSFRFDGFSDNGMIRVEYTSTDGITYIRNTFEGDSGELSNPVDLGTLVKYEEGMGQWNDVLGYFMQVGGKVFEGLFEYKSYTDSDIYLLDYSTLTYSDKININVGKNIMSLEKIKAIINSLNKKDYKYYNIAYDGTYYYILPYIQNAAYTDDYYDITNNKMYFTISASAQSDSSYLESPAKIYVVTNTFELDREIEVATLNEPIFKFSSSSKINYKISEINLNNNTMFLRIDNSGESIKFRNDSFRYGRGIGNDVTALNTYISTDTHPVKYKYFTAQNQLTALPENIYNATAYGKDGVIEGLLTQNISNLFNDVNAEIFYKIQNTYNNMEPVIIDNDADLSNLFFIPTNKDGIVLIDTSNVTDGSYLFSHCDKLVTIPLIDTSHMLNMEYIFGNCPNLMDVANINTTNVTTVQGMYYADSKLQHIPTIDTQNVTNMSRMCVDCISLLDFPSLNTSKVTEITAAFSGCSNLKDFPVLDGSQITGNGLQLTFDKCTSLSDDSLNNIMQLCISAVNQSSSIKTLKYIGLTQEQATKCTTLSNYEAFTAAGWTTGY